MDGAPLARAYEHATAYLDGLAERRVGPAAGVEELRAALGGPVPPDGLAPAQVVDELVAGADPGLVATPGPRFFGWVIGGGLPAALAADWLTATWDQHASFAAGSPAATVLEETAGAWALDLLGLPATSGVGFATGAQMANATALAAARGAVLRGAGWEVEEDGLLGAPEIELFVGEQVHASLLAALRLLGLGAGRAVRVAADDQGRMRPEALEATLAGGSGPAIVCAQAGEVNTGASDPLEAIASLAAARGAWLHVDGAFGLWAAASPRRRALVAGHDRADSWAVDAHKWLNVPYDCALAIVRDREAHVAAMRLAAAYLPGGEANPCDFVPEASRRARGIPVYAAFRSLGRSGVAELVDRCCDLALEMAAALEGSGAFRVINDVVLNQVLAVPEDDVDPAAVCARVVAEGTCWVGPTVFRGTPAVRVSVSNWSTTSEDVARSAAAIVAAAQASRPRPAGGPPTPDAGAVAEG